MTTSTSRTVSAEGIQQFAEWMADELGLADLITAERWANPNMRNRSTPVQQIQCRQQHFHITTSTDNTKT